MSDNVTRHRPAAVQPGSFRNVGPVYQEPILVVGGPAQRPGRPAGSGPAWSRPTAPAGPRRLPQLRARRRRRRPPRRSTAATRSACRRQQHHAAACATGSIDGGHVIVGQSAGQRRRHPAQHPHRRAAHRPGAPARRVLRGADRRTARRRADRTRSAATDRAHRRRLSRAAHPALGDRGADIARARARPRHHLVPQRIPGSRRREQAHAPARRRPPVVGPLRQHRADADARRPRTSGCSPSRRRNGSPPWPKRAG